MFFELNGKTYGVKFHREGTTTLASLFVVGEGGELTATTVQGIAVLHHNDRFEKSKGRKVALADLLYDISIPDEEGPVPQGLTKEDRAKIWEEYFKKHNK